MALTLLDLYNSCASQEWSMYDNDVLSNDELENSLLLALNKAIVEVLYSYNFNFKRKTYLIMTVKNKQEYKLPKGIILKDINENYQVYLNTQSLNFLSNFESLDKQVGIPQYFYIQDEKICFYPIPSEKFLITIKYQMMSIGEDKDGNIIYSLKNIDDIVSIPEYLEEIFKNVIISKTMLNSIASERDENYSAYKKQYEKYFKLLIKYSSGKEQIKQITI